MNSLVTGSPALTGEGQAAQAVELSRARRMGILLICCMSLLIVGLDVTIVNVALPSIGRTFHAQVSGLQWTVDAYTLVLASLLMLAGSTADRLGRKRTYVIGLSLFSLGSLLCSTAPSLGLLVFFRTLQAIGGSMLNPVAMSIITNTFTNPRERAQAVGIWGAVVGISMAAGPALGGLLVSDVGWRSIFWINVPVGLTAIGLALRFVPESRAPVPRRVDPLGQVLMIILLAATTYGIIELPGKGLSPVIVGAFVAAAAALIGFIVHGRRSPEPLVDLRFFRSIPFSSASVTAIAAFATLGGFLFLNTLYLQEVRGLSPLQAGLRTLPMAATMMIASPISGRIVGSRGSRLPLVLAGALLLAACVSLASVGASTSYGRLYASYVVFGLGFGLVNAPITNAAVSGMPRAQAGVAAAIASTSRQIGATLGVAVVGALVASNAGTSLRAELAAGSETGWWVLSGCGALVLVLGLLATSRRALDSAHQVASELNHEALAGERIPA